MRTRVLLLALAMMLTSGCVASKETRQGAVGRGPVRSGRDAMPALPPSSPLTVSSYGDRLWPAIRPQLAARAPLTDACTYSATWAPADSPDEEHFVVSYLSDQPPVDNGDEPSRWSHAAAVSVESL